MKRRAGMRIMLMATAGLLLGTSSGCTEWLALSNVASFGAGWLFRDATMQTTIERACYQNGVLVDCSTLPDDLGQ